MLFKKKDIWYENISFDFDYLYLVITIVCIEFLIEISETLPEIQNTNFG